MKLNIFEKENPAQQCLEKVKNLVFYYEPYDKDFGMLEKQLVHSEALQYGFRYNAGQEPRLEDEYVDYKPLVKLLLTAENTDLKTNQTNFPDFKCENGLIEHFQVTATKETKKGAKSKQEYGKNDSDLIKEFTNDLQNNFSKSSYEKRYSMPNQSYENFVHSFKENWKNHIESLKKYEGNKQNVCFLIESDCYGLKMRLAKETDYILGIRTGKIVENYEDNRNEKFATIMLGRCKELLKFVNEYKNLVQYIIFVSPCYVELIKTSEANYIVSLLKEYQFQETIVENSIIVEKCALKENQNENNPKTNIN